jgi:hypothetical protein
MKSSHKNTGTVKGLEFIHSFLELNDFHPELVAFFSLNHVPFTGFGQLLILSRQKLIVLF